MPFYIALAAGIFLFSLVLLLLGSHGVHLDSVRRRVQNVLSEGQKPALLDEELQKPFTERFIEPVVKALAANLEKLVPKKRGTGKPDRLKIMLRQAGYTMAPSEYSLLRLLVIGCASGGCFLLCILLGERDNALYGALVGLFAGYTVMRFSLTSTISRRRRAMEQQLPDVLDLLSINVEAGLGFEQALLHVVNHFEGPLIDELAVTCREMTMGRTRREALTLFGERCGLMEVKSFAGAVVQAETLGISMKNILRTQAQAMRTNRRNKVEEKAQKISVKIILPMVGLIFPVLLIVLMGPAVLKIVAQFA